ncbi:MULTISPECIES: AAA family ATPase [Pseudoalteromonas]|uniref:AAA family ATPase n=1 Tax=Pseudoalteromonas TaxID=53246 RepID=UPI0016033ADA|nr:MULTISPECIES: ATP-binding protein [unclassified Pseudoalteromonas]MBB1333037.1 ATP-binding protein [Pseudoalteromonas sp. SR41-6]MBB1343805.1 ATP-binding protein [Pseudoalteromonas sp. SR45-6]MBB1457908.1 ATP-binding protein [Pseudoalteromonas sp. SG41-8]
MIIEMFVENFRSIKHRQSLNLTKTANDELEENTFELEEPYNTSLLKTAAIYGANSAGKSNFILALNTMKSIVMNSAKESQRGDELPVSPFRLSKETAKKATEFEVVFIAEGVKYQYGFSLTNNQIKDEWLFSSPKGRAQRWFIRAFDEEKQEYIWDFSSYFQGKKQLWKESTKANSLFLSTAVMLNSQQLKPVYDWFAKTLKVTGINGWDSDFTAKLCENEKGKQAVLKFLKSADLDISNIALESHKIDSNFFPAEMPNELKESLLSDLKGKEFIDVKTIHKDSDGDDVLFDLDEESDGTQKLFSFAGPWIDSLEHGKVLFIDELHDSLHPNMVKFLIKLFNNKKTNPKNAQLVFTTHETSILDQRVFRRDQIWFCNKEKDQSTTVYPLTDFSPRKGTDNLEKAYLSGRYGALPLVSNLEYLGD